MDPSGNPAYIAKTKRIHWKNEYGRWRTMEGCGNAIAFGGDGSFYKTDCDFFIYSYDRETGRWEPLGATKAVSLSADDEGNLWIINYEYRDIQRWNKAENTWENLGLSKVKRWDGSTNLWRLDSVKKQWLGSPLKSLQIVSVGMKNQVYFIAGPNEKAYIYKWVGNRFVA